MDEFVFYIYTWEKQFMFAKVGATQWTASEIFITKTKSTPEVKTFK